MLFLLDVEATRISDQKLDCSRCKALKDLASKLLQDAALTSAISFAGDLAKAAIGELRAAPLVSNALARAPAAAEPRPTKRGRAAHAQTHAHVSAHASLLPLQSQAAAAHLQRWRPRSKFIMESGTSARFLRPCRRGSALTSARSRRRRMACGMMIPTTMMRSRFSPSRWPSRLPRLASNAKCALRARARHRQLAK